MTAGAVELHIPQGAAASAHFDARAATDAWLATVSGSDRQRSDAYFEGGYWLILWDFLSLAAVMLILLETRISARLRDLASRVSKRPWLHAYFYWIGFATISPLLLFPLTIYESFFREHAYGLSNQSFGSWLRDQLIGFALVLFIGGLIVATLVNLGEAPAAILASLGRGGNVGVPHFWGGRCSGFHRPFVQQLYPVEGPANQGKNSQPCSREWNSG